MLLRINSIFFAISALFLTSSCDNHKEENAESVLTPQMQENVTIIRSKIGEYINAINSQDIETVVNQWSDQAVYKNPFSGELVNGREGVRSEYQKLFSKLKDGKVSLDVKTIRFPIAEKAVEEGTATLMLPGQDPIESDYKMIYVNEDGNWLILHVSELGFGLDEN